ncbi:hypothetical protein F0M18_00570 [Pseudohalioglobus sediminis]|uniref:Uncharacterized protein n=1 Tax=Pseudohalioglobus sediminis TaxID=2606449 RepID=A0A5B0X3S3_9GAMM|nr:hypothetical protein [Pseudohalioglobus sediminis]KAA1193974.1 hypothetical protein F0M18_00570 [Pseudohalioglobus sediminis]
MLDILCRKTSRGDLHISQAERYLARGEWGRARMAVEEGFAKGRLSEPERARRLLQDICARLGVTETFPQ